MSIHFSIVFMNYVNWAILIVFIACDYKYLKVIQSTKLNKLRQTLKRPRFYAGAFGMGLAVSYFHTRNGHYHRR